MCDNNKNPSKENMSSLKNALADVLSKPKAEENKTEKHTQKVHEGENVGSKKEVPEEVLRELLK